MFSMLRRFHLTLAVLLLIGSHAALAQNSKTFGDYEVFYSVLNSTFIKPEVAQRYNITRGSDKALVNISVRKHLSNGQSVAQAVAISGSSSDLIHSLPLEFTEHRETDAIYYLAQVSFHNQELRSFIIDIKPEPNAPSFTLKFNQTLYVEE